MQHAGAGLSPMLLHKSAFREMLSPAEKKRLDVWKSQIRKKMDKPLAVCVYWMKHTLRKSQSFRQGFLSCGERDLGHFAVLHAIRSNNLPVLRFLIEARDPQRFCLKYQGTAVLFAPGRAVNRLMPNAYEDDEPYLYTAILHGTAQCVEQLLMMLAETGTGDGLVRRPANGFCQNTTLLSLALRRLCTSAPSRMCEASEKVKHLLLHGANPMLPDAYGATSLTVYCEHATAVCAESVLKGLLYNKVSNTDDRKQMWAMVTLLSSSFPRTFGLAITDSRMWMESGVYNPLQIPAANGNTWLLCVLLHAGVKLDTVDHLGRNALFAAIVSRVHCGLDGVCEMAGAGVVFESPIPTGRGATVITTPLVSLNFLIRRGINTHQVDSDGCTPIIHLLLHFPHSDYLYQKIDLLYMGGVDVEHISQLNHTALSLAEHLAHTAPDTFNCILQLILALIKQNRTLLHEDMHRAAWGSALFPIPFHIPNDMFDVA
jgi:ankyrin repeat protein